MFKQIYFCIYQYEALSEHQLEGHRFSQSITGLISLVGAKNGDFAIFDFLYFFIQKVSFYHPTLLICKMVIMILTLSQACCEEMIINVKNHFTNTNCYLNAKYVHSTEVLCTMGLMCPTCRNALHKARKPNKQPDTCSQSTFFLSILKQHTFYGFWD